MKAFLVFCSLFFFTFNASADNIRLKVPAIEGQIETSDIEITDSQVQLICHFFSEKLNVFKRRVRYAHTYHKKISANSYSIKMKKLSLTEILPTFELKRCAYKLILIGKDHEDKTLLGDLVLLGSEEETMDNGDIVQMKDDLLRAEDLYGPLEIFINDQNNKRSIDFKRRIL